MTRVLIVDDNVTNAYYLTELLRGNGFRVETANNGAEALEKSGLVAPDLVITDLLMPTMDGYTLLRHWKTDPKLKTIPFIVYTATYTDPEDERLAVNLGADAFLLKPAEPEVILALVREVMNKVATDVPPHQLIAEDEVILRDYSQTLIRKLEQKSAQVEEVNRKLQKEILERRELVDTLASILNSLPAHISLIDSQGIILAVNESWQRFAAANMLNSPAFGIGQNYLEVCDAAQGADSEEANYVANGIRGVLRGELKEFVFEYPCHSPTEQRWFRMMVTPQLSGQSAGAVVMHVNITERKLVEQELQESKEQSLLLLNSTAEGIYGLDPEGICTFCNPAAATMLGHRDLDEIVGKSVHELHHFSHADGTPYPRSECKVRKAFLRGEGTHVDDEVFFRVDGTQIPVEYWSHPIRRNSRVVGSVVTFLDITQRKDLEAQFRQSQKMEAVGQLAGGVAHDFNNTLAIILGYGELLEERLAQDDPGKKYVNQILLAQKRAKSLTHQLLAFSRKQLLRPMRLNLNSIVSSVGEMLRRLLGADIRLKIACDPTIQNIQADPGQIEQVLMNLAVNSRDAMARGGDLVIRTSNIDVDEIDSQQFPSITPGRYSMLSVSDTGTGIAKAIRSRIFEPFFTTKEAGKGTGLGLSTVYGIVKQSGGQISVQSEAGEGTTVRVYFPSVAGVADTAPIAAKIQKQVQGSEVVLLVEDEESIRNLISNSLRANGYTVIEVWDGNSGIEVAGEFSNPIDLLITDVILPGISGPDLAKQLQALHPSMAVLFISGYTDDYISRHGVIQLDTMLLEKPFSMHSLLVKVQEVLHHNPAAPEQLSNWSI